LSRPRGKGLLCDQVVFQPCAARGIDENVQVNLSAAREQILLRRPMGCLLSRAHRSRSNRLGDTSGRPMFPSTSPCLKQACKKLGNDYACVGVLVMMRSWLGHICPARRMLR